MIEICRGLGLCGDEQIDAFDTMVALADLTGHTPNEVDKMFWLIGSGKMFAPELRRFATDRDEFVKATKRALKSAA